jgi:hypothetical protein
VTRNVLRRISCLTMAALLAGCVTRVTLPQRQALDSLVGKTQAELMGELGRPTSVTPGPAGTLVHYAYSNATLQPDEIGAPDNPELTLRNHLDIVQHRCDTVFQVQAGRVAAWSVNGSDCWQAPYPYLGNLKREALMADASQGRALRTPFLFNSRTGNSVVLSNDFQTR